MNKFDEAIRKIKGIETYVFDNFASTRDRSLVITKLQEARMWMQESKLHNSE